MLTLNANSFQCSKTDAQTAFAGKNKSGDAPSGLPTVQQERKQQEAQSKENWQKLQERKQEEAHTKKLLAEWNEFQDKFTSYTAPNMENAVNKMTDAIQGQANLAERYTNGAKERYEESGKLNKAQKALLTVRNKLGMK